MERDPQIAIGELLTEAEQAVDGQANGLIDRTDLQRLLDRLVAATRQLLAAHEQLQIERDELASRLTRLPHLEPYSSGASVFA